jgi:hypothetical protein
MAAGTGRQEEVERWRNKMMLRIAIILLAALRCAGQDAPAVQQAMDPLRNDALRAVSMLRDEMKDPESFTLMQAVFITRQDKKDPTQQEPFVRGCAHYIASNSFGGRLQKWASWSRDRKGRISVYGGQDSSYPCMKLRPRETLIDITPDAVSSLEPARRPR